jgi:hypothetical protein
MRRILAIGGGFTTEKEPSSIDAYIQKLVGKSRPRICFIPTPSGDNAVQIDKFHAAYGALGFETSNLSFFNGWGSNVIPYTALVELKRTPSGDTDVTRRQTSSAALFGQANDLVVEVQRLPPALARRKPDVPAQGAHGHSSVGATHRFAGNRSRDPRGRAQSHDGSRTSAICSHRLNSASMGYLCLRILFMQQRLFTIAFHVKGEA